MECHSVIKGMEILIHTKKKKGGRHKRNSDPSLSGSKVPTIIYSFTYLLKFYLKAKMMLVVHSL